MITYLLSKFIKSKKIIPNLYVKSIYDIPYTKLYDEGKRLILTDLDNTLISYKETNPTTKLHQWKEEIKALGFEIIIVSNSRKNRVEYFAKELGLEFVKFAKKPLKIGIKKAIKKASRKYKYQEIFEIGDQLMTDVYGSRRVGLYTILVDAIDKKTEIWTTRFNRRLEIKMIKKAKKNHYNLYKEILKQYAGDKDE